MADDRPWSTGLDEVLKIESIGDGVFTTRVGGRVLTRRMLHSRDGRLVASMAQEH